MVAGMAIAFHPSRWARVGASNEVRTNRGRRERRPRGPRPTTYRVFPDTRGGAGRMPAHACPPPSLSLLVLLTTVGLVARGRPRAGHTGTGVITGIRSSSAGRSPCRRGNGWARSWSSPAGWRCIGVATGDVVVLEGPVTVTGQVRVGDRRRRRPPRRERARRRRCPGRRAGPDPAGREGRGGHAGGDAVLLEAPLAVLGELLGPVAISISVLILGLVLVLLAPRGADAVANALGAAPLASLDGGSSRLGIPVTAVALVVSVLGVPLGLALFLSLGFWWLVGHPGLVRPRRSRPPRPRAGVPRRLGDLAAVGLVPILNAAAWVLAPVLGVGAMLVAAWRAREGRRHDGRHRRGGLRPPSEDEVEAGIA